MLLWSQECFFVIVIILFLKFIQIKPKIKINMLNKKMNKKQIYLIMAKYKLGGEIYTILLVK